MDSMMIRTHAAKLTRAGIIYYVNHDALMIYASLNGEDGIIPSLRHYLDKGDCNAVIYHNKDCMDDQSSQNEGGKPIPRSNKDISGSGLQSPEDPDADIQPNTYSDSDFMKDTISAEDDPEAEEQITTDGAYYSSENARTA